MIQQIDDAVLHFFGTLHMPVLNQIMIFVSALGNAGLVWIIICAVMLCKKSTRKCGVTMAVALIIGLLVCNLTLKPLIARVRPFDAHDIALLISAPSDWSFPSGHTVSSFGAATSALITLKKRGIPFMVLAVLIAFSRLYLQVHYLSDVLVGCLLGCLFAVISNAAVSSIQNYISKRRNENESKQ